MLERFVVEDCEMKMRDTGYPPRGMTMGLNDRIRCNGDCQRRYGGSAMPIDNMGMTMSACLFKKYPALPLYPQQAAELEAPRNQGASGRLWPEADLLQSPDVGCS